VFFRDVRAGLRRRWYLAVVGVLLTLAAGAAVFSAVPPTYEAKASVVLVPPSGSVPEGSNPYLYMGGLATTVDVLSRSLSDEQTRHTVLNGDGSLDYTAAPDTTSAGPILLVTASGPTPETSMATLKRVVETVPTSLGQIQSSLGIAPRAAITSMTLTQDDKPTPVQKTRIRATLAVVAVFAAMSLLLIALIDGLLLRRRARERRRYAESHPLDAESPDLPDTPRARDPEHDPELVISRAGRESSED
jgi:hypothetical protein